MEAIVAVYSDWGIGADGTQPVVIKADRKHFVELTRGRTVIVGRKTLADFPGGRPLKGRRNIVLTRRDMTIDGAEIAHSANEAFDLCRGNGIVLGGQSVFREMLPYVDTVYVTKISCCPPSDSYFENLDEDPGWRVADSGGAMVEDGMEYEFLRYERVKP